LLQKARAALFSSPRMDTFHIVLALALVAALGFQVWLTARVWRSTLYEREQKLWQSKLIWLLPVLGAAIVFSVLAQEDESSRQAKPKSHLRS
jgi:hypothetical protein